MPTLQNKGEYLLVEINETYSLKMINSAIREVAAYCEERHLNKVLVDMRNMPGTPSILERHLHGIEVAKVWGSRIKAALILQPERIRHMTENTAVNRGANLWTTPDFDLALKWLGVENK